jgi:hypothetical protein
VSKQAGLGDNLYLSGWDLSGDTGSVDTIGCPRGTVDVTGIDKYAFERIYTHRDGTMEYTSFFDDAAGAAHLAHRGLPRTDVTVTYCRGTALGASAACMVGKQVGYDPTRGADGSLTLKVSVPANGYGLEWGRLATAGIRLDTGATNGTAIDNGAASANGLQAYLHVFAFTGTDATVTIQESADNGGADPFAAVVGGVFAAVTTAPGTQRIATSNTLAVERYLRVVTTTAAGFTVLRFAVVIVRNQYAEVF